MTDRRKPFKWVNTYVNYRWSEDERRYVEIEREGYWYDGPWTLAKDTAPIWVAEDYRVYADDAVIGSATALAAENTAPDVAEGGQVRLRVNVGETAKAAGTGLYTGSWTLQYSIDGAAFVTVGAATAVKYFDSTHLTNGTTLAVANYVLNWSGSEVQQDWGDECEDGVSISSGAWSNDFCEIEYTVDLNTVSAGSAVTFRVVAPDTTTNVTFTNVPTINVITAPADNTEEPLLGELDLAGSVPTLQRDDVVDPTLETLDLTGAVPTLVRDDVVNPRTAPLQFVYVYGMHLAGQRVYVDVTASGNITKDPLLGSLALSGELPVAIESHLTEPTLETLALQGSVPTLLRSDVVDPTLETLALDGSVPTLVRADVVDPTLETLALDPKTPTVQHDRVAKPTTRALSFASDEPVVSQGLTGLPLLGELDLLGSTPTLIHDHVVDTLKGALALDGKVPSVVEGLTEFPLLGELDLLGSTPTIIHDRVSKPTTGTLALDGKVPVSQYDRVVGVPLADVSFVLTGELADRELTTGAQTVDPLLGSLALSGKVPTAPVSVNVSPTTGALALDGKLPTLQHDILADVPKGALVLDGKLPVSVGANPENPPTKALVLSGKAPTAPVSVVVSPDTGSIAISGKVPTLQHNRVSDPTTGTLTLTGKVPILGLPGQIEVRTGILEFRYVLGLQLRGIAPTVTLDEVGAPTLGALALSGKLPVTIQNHVVQPTTGTLVFDGKVPSLGADQTSDPTTGALVLSGKAPDLVGTRSVSPTTGSLALSGKLGAAQYGRVALPATGSLVLTPSTPVVFGFEYPQTGGLSLGGQPLVAITDNGTRIVNPGSSTQIIDNTEYCDLSGFKQMPGSMKLTWNRYAVRQKSYDSRHPADGLKGKPDRRKRNGQQNAEQDDSFITTDIDPEDF